MVNITLCYIVFDTFSGRELADIFLSLPSKEEYPEYYEVIKSPMSLQLVLVNLELRFMSLELTPSFQS